MFCPTVFTTNFDPLLQRALQFKNQLYYMSDRPDSLEPPEDDDNKAIHLIYVHGSIHRYFLINSPEEIGSIWANNSEKPRDYLQRHGVIVLGYGGWDDALMEALQSASGFAHNLYWCDCGAEPSAKAKELLSKNTGSAFYVQIPNGAGDCMQRLHRAMGFGVAPKMVFSPLDEVADQLDSIQISGSPVSIEPANNEKTNTIGEQDNFATILERTRTRGCSNSDA